MPTNPKSIEEKIHLMIKSWQMLAPTKSFAGLTLDQFKAIAAPALAARERIAELQAQLTEAINDRDSFDAAFLTKAQQVINGIMADPTEGPDSSLIEAMGRVRKSERRTGLTRKGTGGRTPLPPTT